MALACFILFHVLLAVVYSKPTENDVHVTDPPYPTFSTSYYAKGQLYLPYAEIAEPFEVWYDGPHNKSRIDYYGGVVQTWQRPDITPYGTNFKVVPMTTKTQLNVPTCFQVNGTENATINTIQSVFPDPKLCTFKYYLATEVEDKKYDVWQCTLKNKTDPNSKVNTYTLLMTQDKNPVPYVFLMMGYNAVFGSHYDKYYIIYSEIKEMTSFPADTFEYPKNLTCRGFPGPGISMNPMQEFANGYDSHVHEMFEDFKNEHNKDYKDEAEHEQRKNTFRQNLRFVHSKNREGNSYTVAINHLADRSDGELKILRGKLKSTGEYNGGLPFDPSEYDDHKDIPDTLNWRLYGAVTPVKDQAVCGSCWSFGTTGAIEGNYFVKSGKLIRLSQQALIDCSWGYGNNGCDGGEDYRAYQWIMDNGGVPMADRYGPYLGQDGKCIDPKTIRKADKVQITGYVNITKDDGHALAVAMFNHGPISVSIDASRKSFTFYHNGVYYDPQCKNGIDDLDHSVLAVGYGNLDGKAYWMIKNSWSTYWGNDGYVLISQKDNNCGVATQATFVQFD